MFLERDLWLEFQILRYPSSGIVDKQSLLGKNMFTYIFLNN